MPSVVIKPDRDRDEYVIWSTITDSPHQCGNRAEIADYLRHYPERGPSDSPEERLARADQYGSSAHPEWGYGHWDDDTYIYHQAGILRRADLVKACALLAEDREREVLDLLAPFEDDEGGQWLAECKARAGGVAQQ